METVGDEVVDALPKGVVEEFVLLKKNFVLGETVVGDLGDDLFLVECVVGDSGFFEGVDKDLTLFLHFGERVEVVAEADIYYFEFFVGRPERFSFVYTVRTVVSTVLTTFTVFARLHIPIRRIIILCLKEPFQLFLNLQPLDLPFFLSLYCNRYIRHPHRIILRRRIILIYHNGQIAHIPPIKHRNQHTHPKHHQRHKIALIHHPFLLLLKQQKIKSLVKLCHNKQSKK